MKFYGAKNDFLIFIYLFENIYPPEHTDKIFIQKVRSLRKNNKIKKPYTKKTTKSFKLSRKFFYIELSPMKKSVWQFNYNMSKLSQIWEQAK